MLLEKLLDYCGQKARHSFGTTAFIGSMSVRRSLVVFAMATICGCGESGPFEYVLVSGKVTYEDGSLIEANTIRLGFTALDYEGGVTVRPRPGKTTLNIQDGTFDSVTSYKYADGLVPGKHRVAVVPLGKNGQPLKNCVPEEVMNSAASPLIVDTANLPLEIKVPKP